ncbi:MAG: hypothetical protein JO211_04225 [Acidobacteriaceae bacterium]|nr:hypothetical protein [Acidobacteriaceae bacterium]
MSSSQGPGPIGGGWTVPAVPRGALFIQAIRGPILLITIGALFWLHQEGIVPFWRTWPLLLIVIGLMKLFERMAMPSPLPPPQAPYPGRPGR